MGNFIEDLFFGVEPDDQNPIDMRSASAVELSDEINRFFKDRFRDLPSSFPGRLTPEVPDFLQESFDEFSSGRFGPEIDAATFDLISGAPAYEFDPARTTSEWKEIYATPVMQMYQNVVLPMVSESFNIPGVAYSRTRAEGEKKSISDFYAQNVQPELFGALQRGERMGFESSEAAASRRLEATGLPSLRLQENLSAINEFLAIQQPELSAAYQEFLRTQPGTEPYLKLALQASGQVTSALPGFKKRADPIVGPSDVLALFPTPTP